MAPHVLNWYVGWALLLSAFVTGSIIGWFFQRDDFLGGYMSFRRRLIRLGHVAQAALGIVNVLYGLSPWPQESTSQARAASLAFLTGGITMPVVCFLTGWKKSFYRFFFVPVAALILAVLLTLWGGPP